MVKKYMPDGERKNYKSKIASKLIEKFLSFFKNKKDNIVKTESQSEILEKTWLEYQALKAEDIMIPRVDINALDYKNSLSEISEIFLKTRHTRMPVYKNELDNIIGFINIKDILPYLLKPNENKDFNIDKVLRSLLIISPSMKINNLLEKMRQTRTHIALVVDEFGGADGLITIEDLVEEIIGEIEDEHDQNNAELEFIKRSSKLFEASGRITIENLEEKLQLSLENSNEEYDTLGGLILSISSSVPAKGEKITHVPTGIVFEILDSDPRRIKKVLIHLPTIKTS